MEPITVSWKAYAVRRAESKCAAPCAQTSRRATKWDLSCPARAACLKNVYELPEVSFCAHARISSRKSPLRRVPIWRLAKTPRRPWTHAPASRACHTRSCRLRSCRFQRLRPAQAACTGRPACCRRAVYGVRERTARGVEFWLQGLHEARGAPAKGRAGQRRRPELAVRPQPAHAGRAAENRSASPPSEPLPAWRKPFLRLARTLAGAGVTLGTRTVRFLKK